LMLSANEGGSAVAMSAQVLSCALDQIMIILGAFVKRTGTEKIRKQPEYASDAPCRE